MTIADLGSGGGYYTFRFARLVGEKGRVLAVDVNQEFLEEINKRAGRDKLSNIDTILAKPDDARIPPGSADLIFIRNAFHHLPRHRDYFMNLARSLKEDGPGGGD